MKILAQLPKHLDYRKAVRELSKTLRTECGVNCIIRPKPGYRILIQGPDTASAHLYLFVNYIEVVQVDP